MRIAISRAQSALLFLCGTLLAMLLYELSAPLSAVDPPVIHLSRPDVVPVPVQAFMPPPPASFSAISDRPLFNPLRQPIKPAALPGAPAAAVPPPPPNVALVGIIVDGQTKLALIKLPGAPFATGMSIGGDVAGWQLTEIDPDGIVLHSGSSDYRVPLDGHAGSVVPATNDRAQ